MPEPGLSFEALMALPMADLEKMAVMEAVEEGKREEMRLAVTAELWRRVLERQTRLEAKLDTLETMVRVLTIALRSGAVGKWS